MNHRNGLSRRTFVGLAGACGAGLLLGQRQLFAADARIVATEPFAELVELADGVWAIASTPMKSSDWTTGCNGGLVAGSERVLAIESFLRTEGAAWAAGMATQHAGQRPTDVLITHYHGDHANGLAGYADGDDRPRVWMTERTRELIRQADAGGEGDPDPVRVEMLDAASILPPDGVTELDLGGRSVELHPRGGHTPSDVTVELAEPSIVFFGDLLWNGFFPNYRDTAPTPFAASIRAARRERETQYVPGHGALADDPAVGRCLTLVDAVEEAARTAFDQGVSAADAAKAFTLPEPVADWVLFNERYFEVAIGRWHTELSEDGGE